MLSVDFDSWTCETLRQNSSLHGGKVLEADISYLKGNQLREFAGLSQNDDLIIVGGPPCQPFSKASYWTDPGDDSKYRRARSRGERIPKPSPIITPKADSRRSLISDFCRLVQESKADAFLFENVSSILHPRNLSSFKSLINTFESYGYKVSYSKINAVEYGVPQKRHRVFILGLRNEKPEMPDPTHAVSVEAANSSSHLLTPVTVGETIAEFDKKKYYEEGEDISGKWEDALKEIPPGQNYKAITAWAGHPNPIFEAETRFWHFLLKLHPKLPSWTISASPGPWTGPFHWKSRRLRTPELAALQGFPKEYQFVGSRRERIRQIGNALPPQVASVHLQKLICKLNG